MLLGSHFILNFNNNEVHYKDSKYAIKSGYTKANNTRIIDNDLEFSCFVIQVTKNIIPGSKISCSNLIKYYQIQYHHNYKVHEVILENIIQVKGKK